MGANLDLLRDMFPRRVMLSVEEVAEVLAVGGTGGSYEQTRRELKEGRIIPGLRRIDHVWRIPLTALAEALDRMVDVDPVVSVATHPSKPKAEQPASSARGSFGARGRRPDALRIRIEEFVASGACRWVARPIPAETALPLPATEPLSDDNAQARQVLERQVSRARSFWGQVGAILSARYLEENLPKVQN